MNFENIEINTLFDRNTNLIDACLIKYKQELLKFAKYDEFVNTTEINIISVNSIIESTSFTLIQLCYYDFSKVLKCLNSILKELQSTNKSSLSIILLLDTISKCIDELKKYKLIDVIQKECLEITLKLVVSILSNKDLNTNMREKAGQVIYYISVYHFTGVYNYWSTSLSQISQNANTNELQVLKYIHVTPQDIIQILHFLSNSPQSVINPNKKKSILIPLAPSLEAAIFRLIEQYPDINKMNEMHLTSHALELFTYIANVTDYGKKREELWPVQNLLLILCPELLRKILYKPSNDKEKISKKGLEQFVQNMLKYITDISFLKPTKLSIVTNAARCWVDLCRVYAIIKKSKGSDIYFEYLQKYISDLQNLFLEHSTLFSDDMIVDFCVALYYIESEKLTFHDFCIKCASKNELQIIIVKSCHHIVTNLKNNYSIHQESYPFTKEEEIWRNLEKKISLGPTIRNLFYTAIIRAGVMINDVDEIGIFIGRKPLTLYVPKVNSNATDKKAFDHALQLTHWVIKLCKLHPRLLLQREENELKFREHIKTLLVCITTFLDYYEDLILIGDAKECLYILHQPEMIDIWDCSDVVGGFWEISSRVLYIICLKLCAKHGDSLLPLLMNILQFRNAFILRHKDEAITCFQIHVELIEHSYVLLETILLTHVCDKDVDTVTLTTACFEYLCKEIHLICDENVNEHICGTNYEVYQEFLAFTKIKHVGRLSQQKKVWALLRRIKPSRGATRAWDEVFCQWADTFNQVCSGISIPISPLVGHNSLPRRATSRGSSNLNFHVPLLFPAGVPKEQEDMEKHWQNMTGFLCSLGGVKVVRNSFSRTTSSGSMPSIQKSESVSLINLNCDISQTRPQRSASVTSKPSLTKIKSVTPYEEIDDDIANNGIAYIDSDIETFIHWLLESCYSERDPHSIGIGKIILDLLGYELSPDLYQTLSRNIAALLNRELTIVPTSSIGSLSTYDLKITDANTMLVMQTIAIIERVLDDKSILSRDMLYRFKIDDIIDKYFQYSSALDISQIRTVHMKMQLCQLIVRVIARKKDLYIKQELKFRNRVMENLSRWIMGVQSRITQSFEAPITAYQELDKAALKALSCLTEELPLHGDIDSDSGNEGRSKLFFKYFNQLMSQLNYSSQCENHDDAAFNRYNCIIRSLTIKCISNLITSNIQYGLQHALGLGYHEHTQTRTSFMVVLTHLLQHKGGKFDELSETSTNYHYDALIDILITSLPNGTFPFVDALIDVTPFSQTDDLSNILVTIFDAKNKLGCLLKFLFTKEVNKLDLATRDTFLRSNNTTTKIVRDVFSLFAGQFTESVLKPLILDVCDQNNSTDNNANILPIIDDDQISEVDQSKEFMLALADTFFTKISSSGNLFPIQIRALCNCLYCAVYSKFPEFAVISVAIAVFLRYINPVIIGPHLRGIVNESYITPSINRYLKSISKILQNLANQTYFKTNTTQNMTFCNNFLEQNFPNLLDFITELCSFGPHLTSDCQEIVSNIKEQDIYIFHNFLWEQEFQNEEPHISEHISRLPYFQKTRKTLDSLLSHLSHLGPPQKISSAISFNRLGMINPQTNYLRALSDKVDNEILNELQTVDIIYHHAQSKNCNPVFYLIWRRVGNALFNKNKMFDHLIYYFLTLMKKQGFDTWELVLDLTQTNSVNAANSDLLIKFLTNIPEATWKNLEAIYIFHCTSWFKNFIKTQPDERISRLRLYRKYISIDYYAKFNDYIDGNQIRLPQSTINLTHGQRTFHNISKYGTKVLFTVKVCPSCFWLIQYDRQRLFTSNILIHDVYEVSEMGEIVFNEEKNTVTIPIRTVEGDYNIILQNEGKDLHRTLRNMQSRGNSQLTDYRKFSTSHSQIQPSDVPGTILNLALLNMGSSDPALRLASYNLLCVLSTSFMFDIGRRLNEAQGICIPENNILFIQEISKNIAENVPNLTLEFLMEAINGFKKSDPSRKHLCLVYMAPWLENLPKYINDPKTKLIIEYLLNQLTFDEHNMNPSIQDKIWGHLGRLTPLLDTIIEVFIHSSVTNGLTSKATYLISETIVTLASTNGELVSEKIVQRVTHLLEKTQSDSSPILESHILWPELAITARYLLMLSFQNRLNVERYIPELFHFISMIFRRGPKMLRATVHGLLTNCYQNLTSCLSISEQGRKLIQIKLDNMTLPNYYLLFGLQEVTSSAELAFTVTAENWAPPETDNTQIHYLQTLIDDLSEILDAYTTSNPTCAWVDRWSDLAINHAFRTNPAMQPRAFVVLGTILKYVNDDTLVLVMSTFMHCLKSPEENALLMEAILTCLSRLQAKIDINSALLPHLSWFAIFILRLGYLSLYSEALLLLEANLHTLDEIGMLTKTSLVEFMNLCRGIYEMDFQNLDHVTSISFSEHFTFALAILLIRGFLFRTAEVSLRVQRLLTTLLHLIRKSSTNPFLKFSNEICKDSLPLLLVLPRSYQQLTFLFLNREEVKSLPLDDSVMEQPLNPLFLNRNSDLFGFQRSKSDAPHPNMSPVLPIMKRKSGFLRSYKSPAENTPDEILVNFFTQSKECRINFDLVSDPNSQTLINFIITLHVIHNSDDLSCQSVIETLANAKKAFNKSFPEMDALLKPKLMHFLSHSQDPAMQSAVQSILFLLVKFENESPKRIAPKLEQIGFDGALRFITPFEDNWTYPQKENCLLIANHLGNLIKKISLNRKSWTFRKVRSQTDMELTSIDRSHTISEPKSLKGVRRKSEKIIKNNINLIRSID